MTRPGRPHSGPSRSRRPGDRNASRLATGPSPDVPRQRTPPDKPRSRFTGRAVLLGLVLAVLAISYASSMRAYLQQRAHIEDLQAQISQTKATIAQLEREKARWADPSYVKEQARLRFGYVDPGDTSWQVMGSDGQPLGDEPTLNDPSDVIPQTPTPWWDKAWGSVELAGDPPPVVDPPATRVGKPADKITSSGAQ